MKKIAFILIAILVVSSVALSADMAKQGQWGVNTSLGLSPAGGLGLNAAGLKFMVSDNMAIRASLGFTSFSPGGGGSSTSAYGIGAGFEYHMAGVGGVSPYLGGQLGYTSQSAPNGGTSPNQFSLAGVYGGEYFFSSNFSLAGEIGLGFTSTSVNSVSSSAFGTMGVANFIATWYLN